MKLITSIQMRLNETHSSEVCIGKNLSDAFPTQNCLKQGDALIVILFKLCFRICHLEYPRI